MAKRSNVVEDLPRWMTSPITLRHGMGGAALGFGTAGVVNALHYVRELRKARRDSEDPDNDALVIELPRKTASEGPPPGTKEDTVKMPKADPKLCKSVTTKASNPGREYGSGRFAPSMMKGAKAPEGWPVLTASFLAMLGGGALGATAANKLYAFARRKQLDAELEAAKREYAGSVGSVLSKKADTFGYLSYPMFAAATLGILGAAGSGYITKKILDERSRTQDEEAAKGSGLKLKRVVIRQAKDDKEASADGDIVDPGVMLAAIAVHTDRVGDTDRFTGGPDFAKAAAACGATRDVLMEKCADTGTLIEYLEGNEGLRRAIQQAYVNGIGGTAGRVARAAFKMPGGGAMADMAMKMSGKGGGAPNLNPVAAAGITDALKADDAGRLGLQKAYAGKMTGIKGGLARFGLKTQLGRGIADRLTYKAVGDAVKTAAAGRVMPSIAGGMIASGLGEEPTADEIAAAVVEERERRDAERRAAVTSVPGQIKVEAKGKAAQRFLAEHGDAISRVLKNMAAGGSV